MRTRLIVPRRPDNGHRDELWRFCRSHWERVLPEVEIVEGDHLDGPFNRAAAINTAAEGDWDIGVIIDADVILDVSSLRHAIEQAAGTGHVVLPFTERLSISKTGTSKLLASRVRLPASGYVEERQHFNVSTCVVVPRATWNDTRGFDHRFEGWGGEDDAFHAVCRTVATVDRMHGVAWHLWHAQSQWRRDPVLYRQTVALADRYCAYAGIDRRRPSARITPHLDAMRAFLDENRGGDQIVVVCLTNGKRPRELDRTIRSFEERVTGPIGRRLIVGDGCSPQYAGWQTTTVNGGTYRTAMAAAQRRAIGSGQPWIFWLEDDWEFNRPVDLTELQAVMTRHPNVVQVSLQRQAWYRPEKAVGGIFQTAPGLFEQRDGWVAHRRYWTQNPMLTRRSIMAEHPWPQVTQSEWKWAELVLTSHPDRVAGVWGQLDDDPWVHHLGIKRAGASRGY